MYIDGIGYINITRMRRKTIALKLSDDGALEAKIPYRVTNDYLYEYISQNKEKILKYMEKVRDAAEKRKRKADSSGLREYFADNPDGRIRELKKKAAEVLPGKVNYYSSLAGAEYNAVRIRCQRSRWGSASSKKNLSFNCLLMLAPEWVIDYVVVHEVCHLIEMNHSRAFWEKVGKYMPDYEHAKAWLRENGGIILQAYSDAIGEN